MFSAIEFTLLELYFLTLGSCAILTDFTSSRATTTIINLNLTIACEYWIPTVDLLGKRFSNLIYWQPADFSLIETLELISPLLSRITFLSILPNCQFLLFFQLLSFEILVDGQFKMKCPKIDSAIDMVRANVWYLRVRFEEIQRVGQVELWNLKLRFELNFRVTLSFTLSFSEYEY